jgi:hypothetical protein
MHATELPKPVHRDGWVYEEKYDGWRMVAEKVGNQVRLTSRNGLDHTKRFPELVKAVEELDAPSLILDGEIAIFDRQLISRFEWLRARPQHEVATPPMYMVFDLLELEGEDLRPRPLLERRSRSSRSRRTANSSCRRDGSLQMASRHGTKCCGVTTKAWSPRTLSQSIRLAARSRGSRSSRGAIARRLEGLVSGDPTHLAR